MKIEDKADAITEAVIIENTRPDNTPGQAYYAAICELAKACALLTSTSKAEREQGKLMVRQWRHGANFGE